MRDAFARSVLWGFAVAAETGGRVLVDATEWLVRDNLDLAPRLRPGTYKLDEKRSSLRMAGHLQLPEEHRDRGRAHLRASAAGGATPGGSRSGIRPGFLGRPLLRGRGRRRGFRGGREPAHPPLVRRAARLRLQAAGLRPPGGLFRHLLPGALGPPRRAPRAAAHQPASPREEGPASAPLRGQGADRLLPRPGGTRADARRPPGRGAVVEPGLRGGGVQGRLPRGNAASGRPSPGRALQRDQLGASLHPGLEHRRRHHRSAHRRDHQGGGHPGLAAGAPGLPDRRRPAGALRAGRRRSRPSSRSGPSPGCGSSPPTRSATLSASATTTTTARSGASR